MQSKHSGIPGVFIGGWVYLSALLLPVLPDFPGFAGYEAFQLGWKALTATAPGWDIDRVLLASSWFANPAIWVALVCLAVGWWRGAAVAGAGGLILCLAVLPRCWPILSVALGYWAWLGSAALPLVWGSIAAVRESRLRPWQPPGRVALHFPPRLADGRWALTSDDGGEDDEGVTPRRPPEPEWTDGP
jgi:hypothetical protein